MMSGSTVLEEQVATLQDHLKRHHPASLVRISFANPALHSEEKYQPDLVEEELKYDVQKMTYSYEQLLGAINKIEIEAVPFSVPTSKRSSNQGDLVFSAMLRKLVGEEYTYQAAFLIHQLKKVSPKGRCCIK